MPRLNRAAVIAAASQFIEKNGFKQLTIPALAQALSIRPPSLYNHISSLADLKRELSILANRRLCEHIHKAVAGKSRTKALFALMNSYRDFAVKNPGLYWLSIRVPPENDLAWSEAFFEVREVMLSCQEGYDLSEKKRAHFGRAIRSLVHGFVDFELRGGFLSKIDAKESFYDAVSLIVAGIELTEATELPGLKKLKKSKKS